MIKVNYLGSWFVCVCVCVCVCGGDDLAIYVLCCAFRVHSIHTGDVWYLYESNGEIYTDHPHHAPPGMSVCWCTCMCVGVLVGMHVCCYVCSACVHVCMCVCVCV